MGSGKVSSYASLDLSLIRPHTLYRYLYTLDGLVLPTADTATDLGITVNTELKFHSHVQSIAHKASGFSHSLLKATVCRSKEFMIFLLG